MKYLVVLCDGMSDEPLEALGGKTPMEAANKPTMDTLVKSALVGTVLNVPSSMKPESDTANLAVLSYDPLIYSKGRSSLEALSMGLDMSETQTAIRCNVVTLSEEEENYEDRHMLDHSADEISSEEAAELIKALDAELGNDMRHFHPGVSYRHCLMWDHCPEVLDFDRPHDIIGQCIKDHLPAGEVGEVYRDLMKRSYDILVNHPVNEARRARGLKPANSIWLWSPAVKPSLPSFEEKWKKQGSVISAVDLIKGIAICAGMESIDVEGATGNYRTNYTGKANAAIDAFERGKDFVYIHLEATDECGHRGEIENKVFAIEQIDRLVLTPCLEYLKSKGEPFKIMVLPDHPTPICTRTHSPKPVPFFIYSSEYVYNGAECFTENSAQATELYIPEGHNLLNIMFGEKNAPIDPEKDAIVWNRFESEEPAESKKAGGSRSLGSMLFDWIDVITISLVVAIMIMSFLFRNSPVIGTSMQPTLDQGDVLIISRTLFEPEQGDIVIIQEEGEPWEPLVKRIIAVGGQTIKIDYSTGLVYVDGQPLEEDYILELTQIFQHEGDFCVPDDDGIWEGKVPEDHFFVLGDNRIVSKDSRAIGYVSRNQIVGEAVFRIFPLNSEKLGTLD
ncbi:MAG: cofactor-independent phosphoglycerate mutase [Clostridia bacterium]|nr:cofactor-independent phosphoglycerate mutase [Clostridia bacterium]